MVAPALPLAKIGTLFVKTLAKPVSKRIKNDASRYPWTRGLVVRIGQTTHSITSRMTIWSEGYTVRHIKPLDDAQALTTGADFVGESFILLVSVSTVIWEYTRSTQKEHAKVEALRAVAQAERDALHANFKALDERLHALEEVVQYNSQSILNVTGKRYKEPLARKKELVLLSSDHPTATTVQSSSATPPSKQPTQQSAPEKNTLQQPLPTAIVQPDDDNGAMQLDHPNDNNNDNKRWWKFW